MKLGSFGLCLGSPKLSIGDACCPHQPMGGNIGAEGRRAENGRSADAAKSVPAHHHEDTFSQHFLYSVTNFAKMKVSESSSRTSSGTLFGKRGGTCRSACPGRFVHNTRQRMFRCSTFGGKKSAGEIRVARDSGPRPLRIEVGEKGFDLEIIRMA